MIKPENSAIIAVIVPVYNTEDYLRECLESIRTQTFDNFLCIVVNDGSYDSSSAIAHEIADKDVRFRVYDIPNGGVSAARNLALDVLISMKCQVRYVCFVDSDDVVTPDFLNNFVTLMDRFEADYAECGIHYLYADGFIDGIKLSNPSNECIEHDDIGKRLLIPCHRVHDDSLLSISHCRNSLDVERHICCCIALSIEELLVERCSELRLSCRPDEKLSFRIDTICSCFIRRTACEYRHERNKADQCKHQNSLHKLNE